MADDQTPIAFQVAGALLAGFNVTRRALGEVARDIRIRREVDARTAQYMAGQQGRDQRIHEALGLLAAAIAEPTPYTARDVYAHLLMRGVNETLGDIHTSLAVGGELTAWTPRKPRDRPYDPGAYSEVPLTRPEPGVATYEAARDIKPDEVLTPADVHIPGLDDGRAPIDQQHEQQEQE